MKGTRALFGFLLDAVRYRLERLRAKGIARGQLDRLAGLIGLIPAARDPDTPALSALSQIVSRYQKMLCSRRFEDRTTD